MTNKQIEEKILKAIDNGNNTFEAIRLSTGYKSGISYRETDNALRRLKKQGKINFDKSKKVWALGNTVTVDLSVGASSTSHNVTHFGLLVDMSGSMDGFGDRVNNAINHNLEMIRKAANSLGQRATVSLFTFGERGVATSGYSSGWQTFTVKFTGVEGDSDIPTIKFSPYGGTPLYDAIGSSVEQLTNLANSEDSKVLLVITDGQENRSTRLSQNAIKSLLFKTNQDETWTFAAFCPPGGTANLIKIGFSPGNVQAWDSTTLDKELVTRSSVSSEEFIKSRKVGVMSNKAGYFVTDLSGLTVQALKKTLKDLRNRFKVTTVPKECDIREFIEDKTGCYIPGTVFFQLTKAEKLSSQKEILIKEKGTNSIYGGKDARALIGLPESGSWKDIKVKPGNHSNYDIYLQSTSHNRKLVRGTEVIYMP